MAEAAKAPGARAHGLRGRRRAQDVALPGVPDPPALLRQPAGHARPPPGARPVVRHHRPDHFQRAVHRPDGAARRAALSVAALARGARRDGRADHPAARGRGAGATPMLRFFNKEIPYDKIAAVETRGVLFGNAMAPVLLRATRLATQGRRARAARQRQRGQRRSALPFPEIGAKIAQRAGVEVVDAGTVRRSIEKPVLRFFGRKTPTEESPPLTDVEKAEINTRHAAP